jgi:hypothetical protein
MEDVCRLHAAGTKRSVLEYILKHQPPRSWDNLVIIGTRLQAGQKGRNPYMHKKLFSSLKTPDQLWGPPTLLFNGY